MAEKDRVIKLLNLWQLTEYKSERLEIHSEKIQAF